MTGPDRLLGGDTLRGVAEVSVIRQAIGQDGVGLGQFHGGGTIMDHAHQGPLVALEWFYHLRHRDGELGAEGVESFAVQLDLVRFCLGGWRRRGKDRPDCGVTLHPAAFRPPFGR